MADSSLVTPRLGAVCLALFVAVISGPEAYAGDADSPPAPVVNPSLISPAGTQDNQHTATQGAPPPALPAIDPSRDEPTGDNPEQSIALTPQENAAAGPAKKDSQPVAEIASLPLGGLLDRQVRGTDHGTLGHIVDVLIGADGQIKAIVVDIGGFLGVGNRRVAIAWSLLSLEDADPKYPITVLAPSGVIRSAPAYNPGEKTTQILTGPRTTAPAADADKENEQKSASPDTSPDGPVIAPIRMTAPPTQEKSSPDSGNPEQNKDTTQPDAQGQTRPPAHEHDR
ncbi:PRC-barrel domain-containing protein [Acetobacter oeni]|uniref:PRC-barrel domain-containing protein n=1 Tax=Acetobacter oeni TaxID=304077 RepID=UPI00156A2487|nr:PRC-barrel domain-containing protein [Acetobacter oeni]MBB3881333.1 hypothetical protein [Acetobacter oeni]